MLKQSLKIEKIYMMKFLIFLKSKQKYETEINIARKNHPKWHDNQILSLFNLKYPNGMISNSIVI